MKHLEIHADGSCYTNKGSGFAVILLSLNHKWERSVCIGECSANQAVLKAIKFGLLSISESYKNMPIKIYLCNKYARDMLSKDDDGYYKTTPKANKNEIMEIRVLLEDCDVEVLNGKGSKYSARCKELIKLAVKDEPVDTRK